MLHDKKYTSLPKGEDPLTVTLETAIKLIEGKRQEDLRKHLKAFDEEPKLEILNGRYGPYLAYDGKNYRLPKKMHEKAAELTLQECMDIINAAPANRKS